MRLFGIDSRLVIGSVVALIFSFGGIHYCVTQEQQSNSSASKTSLSQSFSPEDIVDNSQKSVIKKWSDCANLGFKFLQILAAVIGGVWAFDKFLIYRKDKIWIQFDIEANLYPLHTGKLTRYSWDRGELSKKPKNLCKVQMRLASELLRQEYKEQSCNYAIEVLLKLKNQGKTRFKLYNAQITISTIEDSNQLKCDQYDGHLKLGKPIFSSGNIVKPPHYYIEPGVEQTIHFLAIIPQAKELLQVSGQISFEQDRIFPKYYKDSHGLFPHTAARTYQIKDGRLVKDQQDSSA